MRVTPWAAGLILSLGLICGCSQQSAATAEQIADAERALETVRIDSEQSKSERDAALAAIHTGVAAVLTSRDQLQQRGAVDNTADLEAAGHQVDSVLGRLRGSQ